MKTLSIYVHIPFCKKKCDYCDFISFDNKDELIKSYIKKLLEEIKDSTNQFDLTQYIVKTIYFGGGTPSHIDSKFIIEIMDAINNHFNINSNVEITIEINPGTISDNKVKDYINCGIQRVSLGLQDSNNKILKTIGRIHTYEDFLNTYSILKNNGINNINIDNIFGLPNQTKKNIINNLKKLLELKPNHISYYSLILEEGTSLYNSQKKYHFPNEALERDMFWHIKNTLEDNGYIHYEISNFCMPSYESKHNLAYWNQNEYLGFGVNAHSYINNVRFSNGEDIKKYIEKNNTKIINETQDELSKKKEYIMLKLRLLDGVSSNEFSKIFNDDISIFEKKFDTLLKKGLIKIENGSIKLTKIGIDYANIVWSEFI